MSLRARLVLAFVLAAALPLAAGTWLAAGRLEEAARRLSLERRERAAVFLGAEERRLARDLFETVERVSQPIAGEAELLVRLARGGGRAGEDLEIMRARFRLDLLAVVEGEGRVLAAAGSEGLAFALSAAEAAPSEGSLWLPATRTGEPPLLVASRPLTEMHRSGRRLRVVGGSRLEEGLVRRAGEMLGLPLRYRAAAGGGKGAGGSPGDASVAVPLAGEGGRPVGWLEAAVPGGAGEALRRELRRELLLTGGVAVVLAALLGAWLAARVARPVANLTRAMEGVGAGDWDLTLPAGREELGRLTAAFNRMTAALGRSRRRALEAERRAAWEEAARRVAHEVKNPLSPIRAAVENLRRARERGEETFAEVFPLEAATILEEVERLRRLVDEFSRFARLPRPQLARTDLGPLVREAARRQVSGHERVRLELELDEGLPLVSCDPDQVAGVVANLTTNALRALGERGGTIRVSLRSVEEEGARHAELLVEDDGPGLSAEERKRVFEPYWTTKERSGGAGLGLAIALRVAREHGGSLVALARSGPGAAFRLRLPLPRGAGGPVHNRG
jgi:signal transduction histidine kinase